MDTKPDSFMMVFNTHKGLSYGLSYTGKTLFMKLEQEMELPEERLQGVNDFIANSTVGHWMGWSDILIVRVDDEESANMYDDDGDDIEVCEHGTMASIECDECEDSKCAYCGAPEEMSAGYSNLTPNMRACVACLNAAMESARNTA
jgi:hypothetical protein